MASRYSCSSSSSSPNSCSSLSPPSWADVEMLSGNKTTTSSSTTQNDVFSSMGIWNGSHAARESSILNEQEKAYMKWLRQELQRQNAKQQEVYHRKQQQQQQQRQWVAPTPNPPVVKFQQQQPQPTHNVAATYSNDSWNMRRRARMIQRSCSGNSNPTNDTAQNTPSPSQFKIDQWTTPVQF